MTVAFGTSAMHVSHTYSTLQTRPALGSWRKINAAAPAVGFGLRVRNASLTATLAPGVGA